jgi:hypothetical protein
LQKHGLDEHGLPMTRSVLIDVARAIILEHEYFGSNAKERALELFAQSGTHGHNAAPSHNY